LPSRINEPARKPNASAIRFIVMGRFRVVAVGCACLLLGACGGTTTKQSSIQPATANRLANESEAVAAALGRGDSCSAASKAKTLHLHVANAIASGSIPQSLAASARSASSRLADRIACTRPPPPPPAAPTCADVEHDKHGSGKHGKGAAERKGCE
jgi:hypothetical protein